MAKIGARVLGLTSMRILETTRYEKGERSMCTIERNFLGMPLQL
jgi:hypothetical protein